MKPSLLLSFLISAFFLTSCAGMNEAECLNANWELIGIHDGERGREVSYANRHQEDCSKHGSQIDMLAYRAGHEEGLRTYCRAENGFQVGRSGKKYSGICPDDLENAFVNEYDIGYEFYLLDKDISDAENKIRSYFSRIEYLNEEIDLAAEAAVQLNISPAKRDRIQQDMKEMQFEMLDLERLVANTQLYLEDREAELRGLSNYYQNQR